MNTLISLCMIVKNESAVLTRCLDSVKGLADEIIIVDTGSTDTTKSIASMFTDKVYDFRWVNDFSKARNAAIQHATGKWILVLDADEYMLPEQHESLRQFLLGFTPSETDPTAFLLPIHNFKGSTIDPTNIMISTGARLFPNQKGIYYRSPIHEQLTADQFSIKFKEIPYSIYHDGYTAVRVKSQNKNERNQVIFESILTENNLNDPYFCFTYGTQCLNSENIELALDLLRKSYANSNPTHTWYFHLLDNLISTELKQNNIPEAFSLIEQASATWPDVADYTFFKGLVKEQLGFLEQATKDFEASILLATTAAKSGKKHWKVNPSYGDTMSLQMLGNIHFRLRNKTEAVQYWSMLLKLQPKNYLVLKQMMHTLSKNSPTDEVIHYFATLYPNDTTYDNTVLYLTSLKSGNQSLSHHYYHKLRDINTENDLLAFDLIQHKERPSSTMTKALINPPIALAAALVYQQPNYLTQVSSESLENCKTLYDEWVKSVTESSYRPHLNQPLSELLYETLLFLYQTSYLDLFYTGLQELADLNTLNRLTDTLYELDYTDEALNLYIMLLDNEALLDNGLFHVAQWYYLNNASTEAIPLVEACLQQSDRYDLIGWVFNYSTPDIYQIFKQKFISKHPQLKMLLSSLV